MSERECLSAIDAFSSSLSEAKDLFLVSSREDILRQLRLLKDDILG